MATISDIRFAPFAAADFDYFFDLRKRTMVEHFTRAGHVWTDAAERDSHRERFDPSNLRMVYRRDERIGFIGLRTQRADLWLELFCIEPAWQNKGIGSKIVEGIIADPAWARSRLMLNVLHGNPAARLYERLGFRRMPGPDPHPTYYTMFLASDGRGILARG